MANQNACECHTKTHDCRLILLSASGWSSHIVPHKSTHDVSFGTLYSYVMSSRRHGLFGDIQYYLNSSV